MPENACCLEVEQGVGLALLAGGLLQGNLCDYTGNWCQGTQQAGGIFQERRPDDAGAG